MAKKKAAQAVDWMTPRFQGKSFFFAGRFEKHGWNLERDSLDKLVTTGGGAIADKPTADTSYLVMREPTGSSSHETKVAQLNAKGASIAVITPEQLRALFLPTSDEVSAMLQAGSEGHLRLKEWLSNAGYYSSSRFGANDPSYLVRGLNLKGQLLDGAPLWCATLEDSDLSNSTVTSEDEDPGLICLGPLKNVKLDGAVMGGSFSSFHGCSCRKVNFSGGRLGRFGEIVRCEGDFTGAKLTGFHFGNTDLSGSDFTKADLTGAELELPDAKAVCFRGACLASIQGKYGDFSGSDFSKANLSGAELFEADFEGCNFSGANLQGASLMNANFKNACVDGANFKGANVAGASFEGVDVSKAKGLAATPPKQFVVGKKLKELAQVAKKAVWLRTAIEIETDDQTLRLSVSGNQCVFVGCWSKDLQSDICHDWEHMALNLPDAFLAVAALWPKATLRCHTVKVEGTKTGLVHKHLKQLALEVWCEVFEVPVPDADELKQAKVAAENQKQDARATSLAMLDQPDGVQRWNASSNEQMVIGSFPLADLANKKLDELDLDRLDFEQAKFDGASLVGAQLRFSSYRKSSFRNANLSRLRGIGSKFDDCDFTGANLREAGLENASLARANLTKADLSGADLARVNLIGANLTNAKLSAKQTGAADFSMALFDDTTVFPKGFVIPTDMVWKGKGVDPRAKQAVEEIQAAGTIDMPQFMKVLEASVDTERLSKALAMLKAERFRLFAQAAGDHLVGVVKSQGDPDLVYSCRLTKDGDFACCTQNLNVCGGLRGALCKHILVLLIGMANGGEVDPTIVNQWVTSSRFKKPVLDKDVMSETLLRYKGAEAGDVDWRPVETIPEDYYAL